MADWMAEMTGRATHDGPARPSKRPPVPARLLGVDDDVDGGVVTSPSLRTSTDNLAFHAVAGLPTLAQDLQIFNEGSVALGVRATIQGEHAAMFTHSAQFGAVVQTTRSNALPETLGVTYHPSAPGHHTATLVLTTQDGTAHVRLTGVAIEARPGGAAKTTPNSPEHGREESLEAATDAARLATEYTSVIATTDSARDTFAARILGAGTALNAKLVHWLAEEGVNAAYATEQESRASNASDVAKFVALEVVEMGLEAAAMANPISAAAMIAVDLGWDMIEAGMDNDAAVAQRRQTVGRLESVGGWAAGATTDVTRSLVKQYAGLMTTYERAKAELHHAANASRELRQLHMRLTAQEDATSMIAPLRESRRQFQQQLDHLTAVVRTMAAEASQAEPRATQAFTKLLDRYLRFRAGGAADAPAHTRTIVTTGYLNATAPRPIGLTGTTIGAVDAMSLGSSVAHVATHRPLAEMTGWNVTIQLSSPEGELSLHQREHGDRIQVIPDAVMPTVEAIGGIAALWVAVDRARVGS